MKTTTRIGITVLTAVVLTAVSLALFGMLRREGRAPAVAPPVIPVASKTQPAVAAVEAPRAASVPDFQTLAGKWLRPDGGYVLELRSIDATGAADAAYFNPRPIHVGKAQVSQDGSTLKLFVELRDVNYPGSTYTLFYDPQDDCLKGVYFQAVAQETYEIFFSRQKP